MSGGSTPGGVWRVSVGAHPSLCGRLLRVFHTTGSDVDGKPSHATRGATSSQRAPYKPLTPDVLPSDVPTGFCSLGKLPSRYRPGGAACHPKRAPRRHPRNADESPLAALRLRGKWSASPSLGSQEPNCPRARVPVGRDISHPAHEGRVISRQQWRLARRSRFQVARADPPKKKIGSSVKEGPLSLSNIPEPSTAALSFRCSR